MIAPNTTITLRPYKTFKDNPEKDIPFYESLSPAGRSLYFQARDHNNMNPATGKPSVGYCNLRILTNQKLNVWDKVTVKSILGVKMFYHKRLLIITILEKGEQPVGHTAIEGFEDESEVDF